MDTTEPHPYIVFIQKSLELKDEGLLPPTSVTWRERLAHYAAVVDNAHDLIHSLTPDGAFAFTNRAWHETLGYSQADLDTLTFLNIIDASCRDRCRDNFARLQRGESIDRIETIFVARDGKKIPVEGRCTALFHDGQAMAMTGIFRDISRNKQTEERLRTEASRLEILLALSHMGDQPEEAVIRFAVSGGKALTQSATGFFSLMDGAVQGCDSASLSLILSLTQAGIWAEALRKRGAITMNNALPLFSSRRERQDDSPSPARVMIVPILDSGAVVAIIGVADKQTDYVPFDAQQLELLGLSLWQRIQRRRVLEALQKSESNYRAIFDAANDAISVRNALDGRLIDVNQHMLDLFGGYSKEEFLQLSIEDHCTDIPPYTAREARALVERAKREGPLTCEWLAKNKKGELFWVEINLKQTMIGGNDCILSLIRDITQRRQTEETLRRAHADLEDQVAVRTQDLTEANAALNVLLKRYELNRNQLEQQIIANLTEKVSPIITRLKKSGLRDSQKNYLELIEAGIKEILSPASAGITLSAARLTPTEKNVANLIASGKTTKEIARLLEISPATVSKHRENIRKKMGITNKKKSLTKSIATPS